MLSPLSKILNSSDNEEEVVTASNEIQSIYNMIYIDDQKMILQIYIYIFFYYLEPFPPSRSVTSLTQPLAHPNSWQSL